MPLFILFYLAIYGGAHAYLLFRTARAFHLSSPWPVLLTALSLFMVAAPILVRLLERAALELPARIVGYLGYLWMGFFFLFLSASIMLDLLRFVLFLAGRMLQVDLTISNPAILSAAMLLALSALVYGLFEARHLRVEQVTLRSPKIPKTVGKVRIVQISDLHLGLMVGKDRLADILQKVSLLKPDMLVSTGDLVDGQMDGLKGLDHELAALNPPLGKYAVLGNHEVFAGVAPSTTFTEKGGFRLLRGEAVQVSDYLSVAGVDDPAAVHGKTAASDQSLLAALPRDRYTILLKHRPTLEKGAVGLFDLQLSGHVHKGQLFPFNLITHLAYPVKMGLSGAGGSLLYVSRGTGTWGPPARVLAPPEITVIDLLPV
ncbi:metallophosphoesterase [Geomonas sp.]|uniref:metallophosphoesterase n=1 Tax=Geomonas sp. TaxID=2651584 RepID=UPI002B460AD7|nr:metallophosphoesterase [Geomonas sp.]HJV33734.1 metallophosphoesterase [Geomonas sp.]